jgi:hypothetical protein
MYWDFCYIAYCCKNESLVEGCAWLRIRIKNSCYSTATVHDAWTPGCVLTRTSIVLRIDQMNNKLTNLKNPVYVFLTIRFDDRDTYAAGSIFETETPMTASIQIVLGSSSKK